MKLKIHPLFVLFGLFYVFTGRIVSFISVSITAVIHELGHSIEANSLGYKLNKIVLMPFGAVVSGDIEGLNEKDEIKIALSGPMVNIATGLLFLALWWIFPTTYAFTDTAVFSSFSIGLINLIPAYPLDGGRVLYALLATKKGKEYGKKVVKVLGIILGIILMLLFILTIFRRVNYSLLFFSVFIIVGQIETEKENQYIKAYMGLNKSKLLRGVKYNKQAVEGNMTIKRLIKILDENAYNEIVVFDGEKKIAVLSQERIEKIIQNSEIYKKIIEVI
ncbi:MAG: site-2 protease family protein [Clostridia bacterium]|nr:site-2 protease family protein [Clostridia bacterium]